MIPPIFKGMKMKFTRKPFLGNIRANLLVALFNAVTGMKVVRGGTDDVFISSNGIVIQLKKETGGGTSITLKTNGTSNSDQTVLNLKSGTGITVTAGSSGDVTINVAGSAGGHTIQLREWNVPNDTDGACDKKALFLSSEKY